jgi:hypothetical protein
MDRSRRRFQLRTAAEVETREGHGRGDNLVIFYVFVAYLGAELCKIDNKG